MVNKSPVGSSENKPLKKCIEDPGEYSCDDRNEKQAFARLHKPSPGFLVATFSPLKLFSSRDEEVLHVPSSFGLAFSRRELLEIIST